MDKSVLMIEMPELSEEVLAEIQGFLETLTEAFGSHYYHQLTRYYRRLARESHHE